MTVHVLTGSKQEIAQKLATLESDVREAIVFVEEPSAAPAPMDQSVQEFFAEMEPFTTEVTDFDDSRDAIYERMEG
jgi:uncharacterized protein YoxC